MLDVIESKIARREYEERVRSLARVEDYDVWLKSRAGNWIAREVGSLLSPLAVLADKLRHKPVIEVDTQAQTGAHVTPKTDNLPETA